MDECVHHTPCLDCGWCPCWFLDPDSNTPPEPILHITWHQGRVGDLDNQQIAELSHAPLPADGDHLADDELYIAGAAS